MNTYKKPMSLNIAIYYLYFVIFDMVVFSILSFVSIPAFSLNAGPLGFLVFLVPHVGSIAYISPVASNLITLLIASLLFIVIRGKSKSIIWYKAAYFLSIIFFLNALYITWKTSTIYGSISLDLNALLTLLLSLLGPFVYFWAIWSFGSGLKQEGETQNRPPDSDNYRPEISAT